MKRIALCLAIVAVLAACPKSSEASDLTEILRIAFGGNNHHYRHAPQQAHAQHHADLQAREFEREVAHRAAHQQSLTYGQQGRLHNALKQAAYQDAVEHEVAHATRAYAPRAYAPRAFEPVAYPPRFTQGYRAVPSGYGTQYGASQIWRSPSDGRVGCAPYGRY